MTIDVRHRRTRTLIWVFLLVMNLIVFPPLLGPKKIVAWWILMFVVLVLIPVAVMAFRWAKFMIFPRLSVRALLRADYDRALLWMDGVKAPAPHELQGVILGLAGRPQEAEQIFGRLAGEARDDKQRARRLTCLAEALMDQGRWEQAKAALEVSTRLDVAFGGPFVTMAEWYLLQGIEPQQALDLVEQANTAHGLAALKPSLRNGILASRLATKALALARLGRHREAEAAIETAFRTYYTRHVPRIALLHWFATMTFAAMGEPSKAREHSQTASAIDPHGKYGKLAARWLEDDRRNSIA